MRLIKSEHLLQLKGPLVQHICDNIEFCMGFILYPTVNFVPTRSDTNNQLSRKINQLTEANERLVNKVDEQEDKIKTLTEKMNKISDGSDRTQRKVQNCTIKLLLLD